MRFVLASGQLLHFEHRVAVAEAPVVVFINSLGTDFRIWDDVATRIVAAGFGVLRYDKRGHGLSGLGNPPYTIADHVQDLAALLDHLQLRNSVICGLSVGGLIAQGLSVGRPDLVRSLVLCDTAHKIGTADTWNARIDTVLQEGISSIADAILRNWFTPAFHAERPADLAGCRAMLIRQPPHGYAGTCAALRDADHTGLVKQIAVPTLCLVGDQDGSTPPALVKSMADLISGARFEIIRNAGHIPCIEQPEALSSRIRDFLSAGPEARSMSDDKPPDRHAQGTATRRAVLGNAHVDRAEAGQTDFDRPFQDLITEAAWGHVWSRPNWTRRERSIVTIALLAALGHHEEVAMHVRATANTGATRDDIREALLHVAIYAGVPAANNAIKLIKQVYAEIDGKAGP